MNADRLRVFLGVVDAGSMRAATQVVHLTQPAISRSVAMLEEDLDTELFERRGRGLALTPSGRALVPRARALIAQLDRLSADVRRVATQDYFDLRIGTVDSVATYLLPPVFEQVLSSFPDLSIKLRTGRTSSLMRALRGGEIDMAIVASSGPPSVPKYEKVGPYSLGYYGRVDRFPGLAAARTDEEVQRFPMVEIESLPGQPSMIRSDAETFAVANSLASVKALVLAGFGVGGLLDFMLTAEEAERLVSSPLGHDPECALYVVYATGDPGGLMAVGALIAQELRLLVRAGSRS